MSHASVSARTSLSGSNCRGLSQPPGRVQSAAFSFSGAAYVIKLKGGRQEIYPIDDRIRQVLKDHRVRYEQWLKSLSKSRKKNKNQQTVAPDYVLPGGMGEKWWYFYESIKASGAAVGIKIDPHKFWHSVAQWYIDVDGPAEGLQLIIGHKSIKTTQGYYERNLQMKRRARKHVRFNLGD